MKELTIGANDAGQRLDRFLAKAVPLLPASLAQKYIRLKRIKRNGARAQRDTRLEAGDTLQLYINDEFFDTPREDNAYLTVAAPRLNIVYEDEHILLVDKRPGLAVHPHDGAEYGRTLIDQIQAYLYQKKEWRPREEHSFTPALCNRIDRNTGGIVIAAKTAEALRVMNQKIKDREMDKRYLAVVEGRYGKLDKRYDRTYQALYAYKLTFRFTTDAGSLAYLNGRSFQVEKANFVETYFTDYRQEEMK